MMVVRNPILRRNICRLSQTHEKWSVMTGATISKPFTKLSLPSSSKTNDINVEKFENLNYNGKHLLTKMINCQIANSCCISSQKLHFLI